MLGNQLIDLSIETVAVKEVSGRNSKH